MKELLLIIVTFVAGFYILLYTEVGADLGIADAQFSVALGYDEEGNYTKAVKWYNRAAEQGHAGAQNNLAICYWNGKGVTRDRYTALGWFQKAAEAGDKNAQYALANHINSGFFFVDYEEAAKWYRKSAEQGLAAAQYELARLYERGAGVPKNKQEAKRWYQAAARQGHTKAQEWVAKNS